jgi:hypothetical protein
MTKAIFENISSKIIEELVKVQESISIAVAWFTNQTLFRVLEEKLNDKIQLTIIISNDEHNFGKLKFETLVNKGATVLIKEDTEFRFMHHKFCVIDSRIVINGSYNWSNNAERNFENVIISDEPILIKQFQIHFEKKLKVKNCYPFTQKLGSKSRSLLKEEQEDDRLFQLEKKFNELIDDSIEKSIRAGVHINYDNLYGMIKRYTAVGAAKMLATSQDGKKIQNGLKQLKKKNLVNLSFEHLIIQPDFKELFDEHTIKLAKEKLELLKYTEL